MSALETAERARELELEEARLAHAERVAELERAQRAVVELLERMRTHEIETRAACDAPACSDGHAMRELGAYLARRSAELRALRAAEADTRRKVGLAEKAVSEAQRHVAEAHAALEAVRRAVAKSKAQQQRVDEARSEADLEDERARR